MHNMTIAIKSDDRAAISFSILDNPEWHEIVENGAVYEPEVINAMIRFIKPGDMVIDAGANLGFFTLIMSRLVGDDGLVEAFEPDPKHFERLRANVDLNDCHNVAARSCVLWHADEEVTFHVNEMNGYSSILEYKHGTIDSFKTNARSLDSIIRWEVPVRLIKIDCEGAEEQILFGAEDLLINGVDCIILELNYNLMPHIGASEGSIRDYMKQLGYDCFLLNPYGDVPRLVPDEELLIDDAVEPSKNLINVMFSTPAKVAAAWAS